jgi:hypothetical protein
MNASAALLSGPFVAGTVKTCERSLGQKGHRPLGAIAGTLAINCATGSSRRCRGSRASGE